jgi:hexosaminidase
MIGWEEILKGGPLPPDAAITSWSGAQCAVTAAKSGHDVVLGIAPTLYFDNRQSDLATEPPGRGWVVSLHDVYALDPGAPTIPPPPPATPGAVPAAPMMLSEADRAHILGVQGNLWTEHIRTEDRLARMAFPRAAAVAEAGWTAQGDRDWPGFLARLPTEMARFSRLRLAEDDSAFAIDLKATPDGMGAATVTLANQTGFGQVRYSLDDQRPTAASDPYTAPLRVTLPARLRAATFVGPRQISPVLEKMLDKASVRTRVSQQLTLCPGTLPLVLEGQAGEGGTRPAFLVQIMNPCWIWPDADLADIAAVKLDVVAAPFNLQLGADLAKVVHRPASTPPGEIQVRLDDCDTGELLAAAPLAEGRTRLEATVTLPPRQGVHALCFAYAGARNDPIWGLRQVELVPRILEGREHG